MTQYVISYFGEPQFASQEEGKAYQEKWMAWIGGLGEAVTTPAMPLKPPQVITSEGVSNGASPDRLTGFTIIQADSPQAAVELAKGCPHLEHGHLEVAELMDMAM